MTSRVIVEPHNADVEVAITDNTLRQTQYEIVADGEVRDWHVWDGRTIIIRELKNGA